MKRLLFGVLLVSLSLYGFGLDWGGAVGDSTYYHYSDGSKFFHADTLSLWLTAPLTGPKAGNMNLAAQGSYTYTTEDPYFFDLDYLKLTGTLSPLVSYTAGRFFVSDMSGYVFSHKVDGGRVSLNFPWGVVRAVAGYTGLLFHRSSQIEMTLGDQSDKDGPFDLASPRVIGSVEVHLPDLFLLQDLTEGMWMQFDFRPAADVIKAGTTVPSSTGGRLNSQYFGARVRGPVIPSLYEDSFIYLGTGQTLSYIGGKYTFKPILSFLGSVSLNYYMDAFLHSKIHFRFLYSSGDSDYTASFLEGNTKDNGTLFIPVSRTPLALVFSPKLGNIFFTKLGYSIKPFSGEGNDLFENIQMELTDTNYFRSTTGQISESGIDPQSTAQYLGTEIDGTVNYRPYSDLGVSLSGGVFMPNNGTGGAFDSSRRKVEVLARLGVSFSF